MSCIDFPACGHEFGCCPDFDESGKQLNMVCVCGKKLPVTARFSICNTCMNSGNDYDDFFDEDDEFVDDDTFNDDNEV